MFSVFAKGYTGRDTNVQHERTELDQRSSFVL